MMNNPFRAAVYDGVEYHHITVEDRVRAVKTFDRAQCHAALALPNLQKTVERAIAARLRQLDKQSGKPAPNPQDGMTVVLEDYGQDFLEFDIQGGRIVETRPFQGWLWDGCAVVNSQIHPFDHIYILHPGSDVPRPIKYPVATVLPLTEGAA